ncbi:MAG TPA: hypothetical protein VKU41_18605, partial [Polyangiaceae bacterium]|nr:hypothetical protein [Polyangiaceae bacterium]
MSCSPRVRTALVLCLAFAGCEKKPDAPPVPPAPASVVPSASVPEIASSPASPVVGAPVASASAPPSATAVVRSPDGGARACRVLRGPIELPLRGPATLIVRGGDVQAVLDDDGKPRVVSFPAPPFPAAPPRASPPASREPSTDGVNPGVRVACAVAADSTF